MTDAQLNARPDDVVVARAGEIDVLGVEVSTTPWNGRPPPRRGRPSSTADVTLFDGRSLNALATAGFRRTSEQGRLVVPAPSAAVRAVRSLACLDEVLSIER